MSTFRKLRTLSYLLRHPVHFMRWIRYRNHSMLPKSSYVTNLLLAREFTPRRGAIVECGTWRGGMSAGLASTLGKDREYYLFDSFEGLPEAGPLDGESAYRWQANPDGPSFFNNCTATESQAREAMTMAGVPNAHLVKGWFAETLPSASFDDGIALLRLDGDWYESTIDTLQNLFPHVCNGGLVLIDDYYTWDGCSRAVHDYLASHKRTERIQSRRGVCYLIKGDS